MHNKLHPLATGAALAGTLVVLFIICALAQSAFPDWQLSHMWLNLFTASPIGSSAAWVNGLLSSVVMGFIGGWVFAAIYNKKLKWLAK